MKLPFTLILPLLIILSVFVNLGLSAQKNSQYIEANHNPDGEFYEKLLPNCTYLNETLMCDRTEISNIGWNEYMAYTENIFGIDSPEYLMTFPDTIGFIMKVDTQLNVESLISKSVYLWHNAFNDYPVIGISLEQAIAYSKWRSDRVFEMLLVENFIIKFDHEQNSDNYFTIDKFLNSKEAKIHKDKITHIPHYFIPSIEDWDILREKIKSKEILVGEINSYDKAYRYQDYNEIPIISGPKYGEPRLNKVVYNILGNVYEMIDDPNIVMGGSYKEDLSTILEFNKYEAKLPNDLVGFRIFCKWVKIE